LGVESRRDVLVEVILIVAEGRGHAGDGGEG